LKRYKVCLISVARSDFSIILPVFEAFNSSNELEVSLVLSGMHMAPEFGNTYKDVLKSKIEPAAFIDHLIASDSPTGVAKSIGVGILSYADFFKNSKPDLIFLTGDRAEMFAAGAAAVPFGIPIAHIHGGETTEGAIDEVFRHSITKMSSLHFVTNEVYARRVRQLGECPDTVFVSGAPALDNLTKFKRAKNSVIREKFGIDLTGQPILATLHPETYDLDKSVNNLKAIIEALQFFDKQVVFTASNADARGREINDLIKEEVEKRRSWLFCENLSTEAYYTLLGSASVMVGNSSSGIIEAASFDLDVINVGDRQKGRIKGGNVIDVAANSVIIRNAIDKVLKRLAERGKIKLNNPYFNGGAADIIEKQTLLCLRKGIKLQKRFFDF
jgi:UDP-hydrolysing UDP-N-acetyl-D-glucosamine 2-epimerase